jgi:hypothetical protein
MCSPSSEGRCRRGLLQFRHHLFLFFHTFCVQRGQHGLADQFETQQYGVCFVEEETTCYLLYRNLQRVAVPDDENCNSSINEYNVL